MKTEAEIKHQIKRLELRIETDQLCYDQTPQIESNAAYRQKLYVRLRTAKQDLKTLQWVLGLIEWEL